MGEASLIQDDIIEIAAHIITYGSAADADLTVQIRNEIGAMWNEPEAYVRFEGREYRPRFVITAEWRPDISELEVLTNTDPRNNYFRIEEYVDGNISFVDGLGCNTGFFKRDNLLPGWTTAAHEFGHTLGLDHPHDLDLRGKGRPGIMYPRGTLVDPEYQYDPTKPAGLTGGTMHPMHRRVLPGDIAALDLHRLRWRAGRAIVGDFSNIFHWPHQ
ncbi:peptidase M10 [Flaviaesturariibacter flavus]|uniref:Peptidase M10 n=1 Tax=Flaviaesturariibacter flavus TaxID=2502780 RepID=A0A4R1BBY0_9BACT|nr:peptidase M10 [Flaviaesturariibacter flavus]TCJ14531.1 peptidase M10 [Flaviaesturariibacter flavus]